MLVATVQYEKVLDDYVKVDPFPSLIPVQTMRSCVPRKTPKAYFSLRSSKMLIADK